MDQVRYGIAVSYIDCMCVSSLYKLASSHNYSIYIGGSYLCYISVLYTLPVTDAAATAPASSSQPSTTTQTPEKPSAHVVGMYMYIFKYKIVKV